MEPRLGVQAGSSGAGVVLIAKGQSEQQCHSKASFNDGEGPKVESSWERVWHRTQCPARASGQRSDSWMR